MAVFSNPTLFLKKNGFPTFSTTKTSATTFYNTKVALEEKKTSIPHSTKEFSTFSSRHHCIVAIDLFHHLLMTTQYQRSSTSLEPPIVSSHKMMKSSNGILSERVPLRQRSTNTQHQPDDAGQHLRKPSQLVDPHISKKENVEPVEIEELRKKPSGEGYTVHRYLRGKMLGKGGFAKVYLCTSLDTNRSYAVKIVPKANLVKSRARQKVCLLFLCLL